jgi:hypothetical protein
LISLGDIVSFNKLILILKIIGQCDVSHIVMSPMKTITSVLKVSTYIINDNVCLILQSFRYSIYIIMSVVMCVAGRNIWNITLKTYGQILVKLNFMHKAHPPHHLCDSTRMGTISKYVILCMKI